MWGESGFYWGNYVLLLHNCSSVVWNGVWSRMSATSLVFSFFLFPLITLTCDVSLILQRFRCLWCNWTAPIVPACSVSRIVGGLCLACFSTIVFMLTSICYIKVLPYTVNIYICHKCILYWYLSNFISCCQISIYDAGALSGFPAIAALKHSFTIIIAITTSELINWTDIILTALQCFKYQNCSIVILLCIMCCHTSAMAQSHTQSKNMTAAYLVVVFFFYY